MGNGSVKKETLIKAFLSCGSCMAAAAASAFGVVTFIGQRVYVEGSSMENTLKNGEQLLCNKVAYRFWAPRRYDIVILYPDNTKRKRWVKRILGLPGETVRIDRGGHICINGERLEENYGKERIRFPGRAAKEITLGEREYWVMGDNRNHSRDSRSIGPIPGKRILGKAMIRIWPPDRFGRIEKKRSQS